MNAATIAITMATLLANPAHDTGLKGLGFNASSNPKEFVSQVEAKGHDYLCGYVRARAYVTRRAGEPDMIRVRLEGIGKDHDPWLAWGECTVEILHKSGQVLFNLRDSTKPSGNPHWKIDRTNKGNLTFQQDVAQHSAYDLVGGIRVTLLPGWHHHR